jgi:hypothetical protein
MLTFDMNEFGSMKLRRKGKLKRDLARWGLPWIAMVVTRLPCHQKSSLFLDQLFFISEQLKVQR